MTSEAWANRVISEQVTANNTAILVSTTVGSPRVYLATSTYGGGVSNVSLFTSSNAVISSDKNDNIVLYSTGSIMVKGVQASTLKDSSLNVKAFGATGDCVTNDAPAIQAAIDYNTTQNTTADIFFPSTSGCYLIGTKLTVSRSMRFIGEQWGRNYLATNSDITILSIKNTSDIVIEELEFIGPANGISTQPGIYIENTPFLTLDHDYITHFYYGVQIASGASASFQNSIYSVQITSNVYADIFQMGNGVLNMYDSSLGASKYGLQSMDGVDINIFGGDCEGPSISCFDLDADVAGVGVYTIDSVHFEGSASAGDIRLGNTKLVKSAVIRGNDFASGSPEVINAVNVSGLQIMQNAVKPGVYGIPFLVQGSVDHLTFVGDSTNWGLNDLYISSGSYIGGPASFGTGTTKSTFTAAGYLQIPVKTKAQIDGLTPGAVGEPVICSNCVVANTLCSSTGTLVAQFRASYSTTVGCGSGN